MTASRLDRVPRPNPAKSPTIRDIAAAADVSPSTVSRVFNRPGLISDETVDRVTRIAADIGYTPNVHARSLITGRKDTVALLIPDISNPFFPPLIKGVERYFQERRVAVLLAETDEEPELEAQLAMTIRGRADGLIIASPRSDTQLLVRLAGSLPVVLVNRDIPDANRVLIETGPSVRDAVNHLVALGHRRIAYLAGPEGSWSNKQRLLAFNEAIDAHGVIGTVLASEKPDYASGRRAAEALLVTGVTSVVAYDDALAHGVMAGLSERGLSVPGDMSVVGCDDLVAPVTVPPMTSISASAAHAGELAARQLETLMARVGQRRQGVLVDRVPSSLRVRATTAAPKSTVPGTG